MSLENVSIVPLKDVVKRVKVGFVGSCNNDYCSSDEGVPMIRTTNLTTEGIKLENLKYINNTFHIAHKKSQLHFGDILIARHGHNGLASLWEYKFDAQCLNVVVVEPDESLANRYYLTYLINSPLIQKQIKSLTGGSVQSVINTKDIADLLIPIPSLDKQKEIADFISLFNKKISVCKSINKNLDDILDSIFKENFIKEFDNDNNDWKIKNIGELPLIITDYVANGSFASLKENVTILDYEEYAYFIRNTDLKSKSFQKFVNKHSYDFLKKSSLFGNEVIISNVGDVGSVFLCPFLDKPMTLGNNMILVKSRDDAINLNFYLFLLFRSNYGQYLISTITAGSVQSKFNKTEFKSLELTMPNDELIIKFNNLVSPIFDYKNKISDEIVRLTKLRDTLLPKLMSGEIDVSKINCDLKIIIRKIYIKSSKLFLWRYLSENQNYIKNTKSNETLLKSRTIYQINKFLAKFNARYRYYRQ